MLWGQLEGTELEMCTTEDTVSRNTGSAQQFRLPYAGRGAGTGGKWQGRMSPVFRKVIRHLVTLEFKALSRRTPSPEYNPYLLRADI